MVISRAVEGASTALARAREAVADVVNTSGDGMRGVATTLFQADSFEFGSARDVGLSLWDGAKDLVRGEQSMGQVVGGALDTLGLPDWAANIAGAGVDFMTSNPRGAEQLMAGLSGIAGNAGLDGLSGYLQTASSVTGMAVGVGQKAAMTYFTAGSTGALSSMSHLPGQLRSAVAVVDAVENRQWSQAGSGSLSLLQGNTELITGLLGGVDPGLASGVERAFSEGERLMGLLGNSAAGTGLPSQALRDSLPGFSSSSHPALPGLISQFADHLLATPAAPNTGEGTNLFSHPIVTALTDQLFAGLPDEISGAALQLTTAMLDQASTSPTVSLELADLMLQLVTSSQSTNIASLMGTHIRA